MRPVVTTLPPPLLLLLLLLPPGLSGGSWAAWMPPAVSGLSGSCVSVPCRFGYPEELRPSSVHGLWYFGSPYPKNYPPVVARSRPGAVHESFAGRARLEGDPGVRDCSLLLGPLSPELAGRYYFRGDLGGYNQYSFSEHTTLEVLEEPVLEVPPEVVAGVPAELRCRVPDSCPRQRPRVSWEGAEDLPERSEHESREDSNGAGSVVALLRFRPRRGLGGHRVGCQVTLPNSSLAFAASVALDVQYEPQVLEVSGPPEALEGAEVELGCSAEGRPPPLLSWFRGPQVLREEPGVPSLRLHLPQVSPGDSGTYTCVAENRHGRHNRSLELHVAYAPRPPVLNGSLWVVAGDPVAVTCGALSHPAPILTVARGRRVVATAVYEPQVTLEVAAATPDDAGEYLCRAENQHGGSSLAFNITVEYPPVLLPESRCTPVGEGARCVCAASAVPEPVVAFELPSHNVTVAEGHRDYALATPGGVPGPGTGPGTVTGVLTLRGTLEPRLAVLCLARNAHGTARQQLRFHHPAGLVWAKVGPVGAVVAFAVVIALVCYLSQSRRKKASGAPEVTPVAPPGQGGDPERRPLQARWLRGAVGRWALGVGEGPGAPPEPAPPPKPTRGPPEEPPEYAEIRVK
ncbi:myelin-associated glycoprotein [Manacus candei]|uniref:myelin-associated glycoprotein n=1 Tax=Manacus candei TaxID=415023 RepID=UPI002227A3C9|nr:myelin-associated glycoprotein [Manacus candei]XP_051631345.1 myelin-associated glycoprotein [Manacus candei]